MGGLSWGWVFIRVVSHWGGFHQGGLTGVGFHQGVLLSQVHVTDLLVQSDLPLAGHQEPEGNEL